MVLRLVASSTGGAVSRRVAPTSRSKRGRPTVIGSGPDSSQVPHPLFQALGGAARDHGDAVPATAWRSLTVDRGVISCLHHRWAVDDLLVGVQQVSRDAGYDNEGAFFVSWQRWLCWSWCIRCQPVPHVVALARDVADSLNPGTWTIIADLT